MKVFFIFCFAVFFFSGCNNGKETGAKVTGPKPVAPTNSADANKKVEMDLSKVPEDQRKLYLEVASDVKLFLGTMKDGDQIFKEVWPHLVRNNNLSTNLFSLVHKSLSDIYAETGLPYMPRKRTPKECREGIPRLKAHRDEATSSYFYELIYTSCRKSEISEKTQTPRAQNPRISTKSHSNKARKNNQKDQNDLIPSPTKKSNTPHEDLISISIATFKKHSDGHTWTIKFTEKRPDETQNAFGVLFSTHLMNLKEGKTDSGCNVRGNQNNRLTQMECKNLGQDINDNGFIWIKTLSFSGAKAVQVTGEIHDLTAQAPNPQVTEIKAIDDPSKNILSIDLVQLPHPDEPPPVKAEAPKSASSQPSAADAAGTAGAEAAKTETLATDGSKAEVPAKVDNKTDNKLGQTIQQAIPGVHDENQQSAPVEGEEGQGSDELTEEELRART